MSMKTKSQWMLFAILASLSLVGQATGAYWHNTDMEITNAEGSHMYIWIDGAQEIKLVLQPYETIRIPFPTSSSLGTITGSLRAFPGCDPGRIPGGFACTTYANTATKLEWTVNGFGRDWWDMSLVDGYNIRMQVDFPNSGCRQMITYVSQKDVISHCGQQNLIVVQGADGKDYASCMSDCKLAEQSGSRQDIERFCCLGPNYGRHGTCSPSNQYLKNFVHSTTSTGLAYLWPHDNKEQFDCHLQYLIRVTLGGTGGTPKSASSFASSYDNAISQPDTTLSTVPKPTSNNQPKDNNPPKENTLSKENSVMASEDKNPKPEQSKNEDQQINPVQGHYAEITPEGETQITPSNSEFCWVMFNTAHFGCHKQ